MENIVTHIITECTDPRV